MTFNKRQDAHSLRSFSGNYFQKTYEPDIVPLMSNGLYPDQASQLFILIILKNLIIGYKLTLLCLMARYHLSKKELSIEHHYKPIELPCSARRGKEKEVFTLFVRKY